MGECVSLRYVAIVVIGCGLAVGQVQTPSMKPQAPAASGTVSLTLADAVLRAKANNPQFQAALTKLGLAREDRVQARAALLPGVDYNNNFIYTQGNNTASGVFIANNGVHEYISQGAVQQTFGLGAVADYRRTAAAQALARAGSGDRGTRPCSDRGASVLRARSGTGEGCQYTSCDR